MLAGRGQMNMWCEDPKCGGSRERCEELRTVHGADGCVRRTVRCGVCGKVFKTLELPTTLYQRFVRGLEMEAERERRRVSPQVLMALKNLEEAASRVRGFVERCRGEGG